jgi:hypothetical protein
VAGSAQTWPYEIAVFNGISYDVAVNEAGQVTYLGSSDHSFQTPEGLSTRSTLEQVLAAGGKPVIYETGWAHYSVLPSGWCAAFYGPLPDILKAPTQSTKVSRFFKRR